MNKNFFIIFLLLIIIIFFITSCDLYYFLSEESSGSEHITEDVTEQTTEETTTEYTTVLETSDEGRKGEIELAVLERINEGLYSNSVLLEIRVNNNYGEEDPDNNFILLVYFDFDIKNTRNTANEVMRMYSDDLVASMAKQGFDDINEAAIFWQDDYNNRSVKYAYEYKNDGFYISDIGGE